MGPCRPADGAGEILMVSRPSPHPEPVEGRGRPAAYPHRHPRPDRAFSRAASAVRKDSFRENSRELDPGLHRGDGGVCGSRPHSRAKTGREHEDFFRLALSENRCPISGLGRGERAWGGIHPNAGIRQRGRTTPHAICRDLGSGRAPCRRVQCPRSCSRSLREAVPVSSPLRRLNRSRQQCNRVHPPGKCRADTPFPARSRATPQPHRPNPPEARMHPRSWWGGAGEYGGGGRGGG